MDYIREVTPVECRALGRSLRESLETMGIEPKGTELGAMLADYEWIGGMDMEPLRNLNPKSPEGTRALIATMRMPQARSIALALERCANVAGVTLPERKLAHLRQKLDRLRTVRSEAQDIIFELEVAGRIVGALGADADVSFEEPDIRVKLDEEVFGLACKRPRRTGSIARAVRSACKQITRESIPSLIVVGVEALLADSGTEKPYLFIAEDPAAAAKGIEKSMDTIQAAVCSLQSVRRIELPAIGVLLCGPWSALCRRQSPIHIPGGDGVVYYAWTDRLIPGLDSEKAGYAATLRQLIRGSASSV